MIRENYKRLHKEATAKAFAPAVADVEMASVDQAALAALAVKVAGLQEKKQFLAPPAAADASDAGRDTPKFSPLLPADASACKQVRSSVSADNDKAQLLRPAKADGSHSSSGGSDTATAGAAAATPGRNHPCTRRRVLAVVAAVLVALCGCALFASSLARIVLQQNECRALVGDTVWAHTTPKVLFARGLFRDTTCHFDNVTRLELGGVGLTHLDDSIALYRRLHWLNVSGNALRALPMGLAELKDLRVLDVSDNRLDRFPAALGTVSARVACRHATLACGCSCSRLVCCVLPPHSAPHSPLWLVWLTVTLYFVRFLCTHRPSAAG